jgi:Complex I intermediate-associated protein 30 (CIA30)
MMYRYFLPAHGGGWLRRYWQYRLQIVALEWRTSDGQPLPPLTIFDFARPVDSADASNVATKDNDGWRVSDDRVIGGFSTSSATLLRTTQHEWTRHLDSSQQEPATASVKLSKKDSLDEGETSPVPFLRWYGHVDTTVGLASKAQRSGFCALRSPEFSFDGANLRGLYNSLEIQCRESSIVTNGSKQDDDTDVFNRMYTVNLKVASSMPEDIYQGRLSFDRIAVTPTSTTGIENRDSGFQTFVLPFDDFHLTARGRDREFNRQLDDNVKIESIGFVLMDGINGSFQLDLARIRAVNRLEDGSVYEGEA